MYSLSKEVNIRYNSKMLKMKNNKWAEILRNSIII